jgi:LL-H family phage holin
MTLEQIALNALSILIPALVAILVEFLRRKLGLEKIRKIEAELLAKKELAQLAVKMAEEMYKAGHGPEKFKEATKWLAEELQKKGIKVTDTEIEGLINSALREIKDQLGQEWVNWNKTA